MMTDTGGTYDGTYKSSGREVDLSNKLDSYMLENAKKLQQYKDKHGTVKAIIYFYNNVKDGGDLDLKLQDDWKFDNDKWYKYYDFYLRYDDPGNINFGYVGAVLFSETVLCAGAGANQIKKYGFQFGDLSTFYDDPRDNRMIKYGYNLYKQRNG